MRILFDIWLEHGEETERIKTGLKIIHNFIEDRLSVLKDSINTEEKKTIGIFMLNIKELI